MSVMDEERDLVVFEDDAGNELTMEVLDYLAYEGKEYALLTEYVEDEDDDGDEDEPVEVFIMEVRPVGEDQEEFVPVDEALAETLIAYCRRYRTAYAVVCSSLYGKYDEVFRRYGFVPQKGQGNIVIVKALDPTISEAELAGAEHWHMSQGDGESELDL